MNVGRPILDVVPGPRGLVLDALARLTGRVSGRELAKQAGVSTATTARVLADLVDAGIVHREPIGASFAYQFNRDHLVARAVNLLAGVRFDLVELLRSEMTAWAPPPVAAWLFGSAARGDGDRDSDIDLLVVAPDLADRTVWEHQVGGLASKVEESTGNPVHVVEHTAASFLSLERERSTLTANLHREGIELVPRSWAAVSTAA